ncbi:hypothetical protein N7G274_004272 [Stereocaulon virgatum]|uniref:AB hydrolase-1 domain-containing protein n=1 Tax=Stereocaulon virgatum TaxID=373712 RepID=A0ABR4ABF7_9LECA
MSQSTTRPTVFFVHGAWHKASCWDTTRAELHKLDYPTEAIQLKSSGSAVATHQDDTAIIRGALESLIAKGKHVVLVMHSYGGKAGAVAVSGLESAARDQCREKGGIIHCVFLAGFLIPKGKSLADMFPGRPEYIVLDPEDPKFLVVKNPKKTFFNDISSELSQPWIEELTRQSAHSFASKVDSTAWGDGLVPCTYLLTENDQALPLLQQEQMLWDACKESRMHWTIEKCKSGHSVWLTEVPTVVRLIRQGAGEDVPRGRGVHNCKHI